MTEAPRGPDPRDLPARDWPDGELNFARMLLGDRSWRDVPDDEVLHEAEALLTAWMGGEIRMERPKLYDHYALLLLALLRRTRTLEARVAELEQDRNGVQCLHGEEAGGVTGE